jgi:predicted XRE-type DNA-binding protein
MPRKKATIDYEKSSGNVFADLGLPHPEQELFKARLTLQIYRVIKERHLTQAQAGEILGIKQPHVSLLMRNRSGTFSVERLMDFLTALGHDVEIRVKRTRKPHGEVSVIVARLTDVARRREAGGGRPRQGSERLGLVGARKRRARSSIG